MREIGRSVEGRPITAVERGTPGGAVVLVIGVIHGDEDDGVAILEQLATAPVPPGVDLWLLESINPDGQAAQRRTNANLVDLNRNFPYQWAPLGEPGDSEYGGTGPASEPETQAAVDFISAIQPELAIWYHQDLFRIAPSEGRDGELRARYAELTGLPVLRITGGTYTGVAATWERNTVDGTAFIVELGPDASHPPRPRPTPPPSSTSPPTSPPTDRPIRVFGAIGVPGVRTPVAQHSDVRRAQPSAMRWWWRMTSSTMKRRNFSVNAGSRPDSSARARSLAICCCSRSWSAGGSPTSALYRPTAWVILNRSASRCTRAASMLSMLDL